MGHDEGTSELTPREHALLFGVLARSVVARLGVERGAETLRRLVWRYGRERGRRMALRAERRGCALDWVSYLAFGEWRASEGSQESQTLATTPDLVKHVTRCPWHAAWVEAELLPWGRHYCLSIDNALVDGFNPELRLDVDATLSNGDEACVFRYRGADMTPARSGALLALRASLGDGAIRDWAFHMGHVWSAAQRVLRDELGDGAEPILAAAHSDLQRACAEDVARVVLESVPADPLAI